MALVAAFGTLRGLIRRERCLAAGPAVTRDPTGLPYSQALLRTFRQCSCSSGRVPQAKDFVRIAAVGDLHYGRTSQGTLQPIAAAVAATQADILVLCGDLTDYGVPEEARALVKELSGSVKVPIVGVLGNHDYEAGAVTELKQIFADAGLTILDGDAWEHLEIGFAGVKGFAGGFGRGTLSPWGEPAVKTFVQEAIAEALKLEAALARLRNPHRIALLHYAPIPRTVEGEPLEIYPFLGCSRLEEPLGRYTVDAVLHGHAHNGTLEGRTMGNIPVYNVSWPLLRKRSPEQPIHLLDVRLS
jgi:Icc-related predicted phosphoesterase